MSDNPTQEVPDSRPFEERVFARFDSLDGRLDRFESRIGGKVDALDGRLTALEERSEQAGMDDDIGRLNERGEKLESRPTR